MDQNTFLSVVVLLIAGGVYYFFGPHRAQSSKSSAVKRTGGTLNKFTRDISADAEAGKLDTVIGREEEIERIIHILSRRSKNNPLLLGEPGVGKTAIVEGIARRISQGDVPEHLKTKRVLGLDLPGLISGTKYRGEFEERMKQLTDQISSMGRSVILFIDEMHMIEQAKGSEGALNASDVLKPALSRGELQAIGASTWKEYEALIKPDDALNRRFQPVIVGEPDPRAALEIIQGIKDAYEAHHHVQYTPEALEASVALSSTYINDRFLPDKAIDLIDEAGAKVSIEATHHARHAMGLLHAAGVTAAEKTSLLKKDRVTLETELKHLEGLAGNLGNDQEVVDIRRRMEHVIAAIKLVEQGTTSSQTPSVSAEDIRDVVAQWVGKEPNEIVLPKQP